MLHIKKIKEYLQNEICLFSNLFNDILLKMTIVGILLFLSGIIFFFFEKLFDKEEK